MFGESSLKLTSCTVPCWPCEAHIHLKMLLLSKSKIKSDSLHGKIRRTGIIMVSSLQRRTVCYILTF